MSFENVEDVYPLSPAQVGLLYHATVEGDEQDASAEVGSDVYHDQVVARLGSLDVEAFERAWRRVVQRHASLRTAFLWDGLDEPLQVVRERVELEMRVFDWRGERDVDASWQELLRRDRERGFELGEAPLLRLALARVGDDDWRFLWSFHHLLLDGWSARLVLAEVRTLYGAELVGDGSGDAGLEPPFPYRDFIAHLAERDASPAESFWRETLRGFEKPTRLDAYQPPRRGRSGHEARPGQRRILRLDEERSAALGRFARRSGLTLATVLQGAWLLLLSRYARERDVVTGVTVAGRPAELEGALGGVGLFINTLPMRAEVDDRPLAAWLADLQRRQAKTRRFEQTPLAHIQKWSELPAGEALFDHILVIENQPELDSSAGGGENRDLVFRDLDFLERSHYPFALLAIPGERLELQAIYDGARFESAFIDRLLGHVETLLESMPGNAETPADRLPMLGETERHRLLVEWNETSRDFPREARMDVVLRDALERAVAADPRAVAAVCGDGEGRAELTYAELGERGAELAETLQKLGAGPDVPVGLLIERSLDMLVGLVAILEAGAAYVPLDADYPPAHLERVFEDSAAPILLTRRRYAEALGELASEPRVVFIDESPTAQSGPDSRGSGSADDGSADDGSAKCEVRREATSDDLAYLIYTSGSSGIPKGVAVTHRNLVHSTTARFDAYEGSPERFLLLSSFAFDSSVAGLFWTLSTGGTLILPRPGEEKDLDALARLFAEQRPTHTLTLPSLYRLLLQNVRVDSLEVAVVAGEACPPELVAEHFRRLPEARLYNEYGPTEGTVWASVHEISPEDSAAGTVPIGRPIANMRLYLLDEHRQPVPVGVAGELYLAGEGVVRGYWRRPELDAASFVELDLPHRRERAYRTGDLACYRDDGRLLFLGRADSQVKVRGFRIEIEGVEAALAGLGGVAESAVQARTGDGGGGARLLAWVVPDTAQLSAKIDAADLRRRLAERVPAFMVPDAIVVVEALPRRPNGKVDYRRLPDPGAEKVQARESATPPRSDAERAIAAAWAEVLPDVEDPDQIDAQAHFFELGGDSILGIQVVSRLRQAGLAARPRDVADLPRLVDLARELEARGEAAATRQAAFVGEFALSPIQRWFFAREMPESSHWNMPTLLELDEHVTAEALQQALDAVVAHHDLLRARFELDGDSWRGEVAAPQEARVEIETFRVGSEEEASRVLVDVQAGLSLSRSDSRAPLVRAALLDGGERRRLLLAVHHLVVDTVSWIILLEDLERALGQRLRGEKIELQPRTASFAAHTAALEERAVEASSWPAPSPEAVSIPVDFEKIGQEMPRERDAERHRQRLGGELTRALLVLQPEYRVDEALLAALVLGLAPWRGSRRLYVELERHGRDGELDLSRTVGWFTESFPVELCLRDGEAAETALDEVASQLRAIVDPSSFGVLCHVKREASVVDLPQPLVLFNYLGVERTSGGLLRLAEKSHVGARAAENPRSHLLEINAAIRGGRLDVDWIYARTVHGAATIEGLAASFEAALRRVLPAEAGGTPAVPARRLDSEVAERSRDADATARAGASPAPTAGPVSRAGGTPAVPDDAASLERPEFRAVPEGQGKGSPGIHSRARVDGPPTAPDDAASSTRPEFRAVPAGLLARRPELEDAYPLSELQESLLVHRLENVAADSGVLVLRATLRGPLDPARLAEAWRRTIARHALLRSFLIWRGLERPVQTVARMASVESAITFEREDGAEGDVERIASEMGERGLDVERAPVMAWRLLRLGEEEQGEAEHVLLWACHHLLLDGWSSALVLGEVLARYNGRDPGPPPRPFREWVHWSLSTPFSGREFWRQARLEPKRLLLARPLAGPAGAKSDFRRVQHRVESSGSEAGLETWVRRHGVTLGSAAVACWGLVLSEATGSEHVSLGFTSAGRSADFDGLERMVGLFTGVLPMGYRVDPQAKPPKLVRAVLERQSAMQSFPPRPLARLFEGGGVTLLRPPFDSLLTFANFPTTGFPSRSTSGDGESELELAELEGGVTSNFPLTVAIVPDRGALRLDARYDRQRLDERRVAALLARFAALLESLGREPASLEEWMHEAPAKLPEKLKAKEVKAPAKALRPLGGTGAEAPRGATETQLMRIWNDLVAVQEYGRDENFFELGGHSLLVPQMLLRIEQDFGVTLPLGVVFEEATVRAVARAIDARRGEQERDASPGWSPLVAIRPLRGPAEASRQAPLFMVHGLGGEVGWFYGLANFLDEGVPLYGLQSPPEPYDDLESMARRYLQEVRRVQPLGPYRFGGYCIGGGVAYEMACQARDAGEQVSMLVLVDSVPQAHIVDQQAPVPLAGRVKRLLSKEPREMVRSAGDALSRLADRAGRRVRSAVGGVGGADDERPMELDDVLDMSTLPEVYHEPSRRHFRAMRDYRPGPFDGDAWLLRTADERFGEDFGWGELVGGELHVRRIPGRHVDVLKEPHVQVVGAELTAALEASRTKGGGENRGGG